MGSIKRFSICDGHSNSFHLRDNLVSSISRSQGTLYYPKVFSYPCGQRQIWSRDKVVYPGDCPLVLKSLGDGHGDFTARTTTASSSPAPSETVAACYTVIMMLTHWACIHPDVALQSPKMSNRVAVPFVWSATERPGAVWSEVLHWVEIFSPRACAILL